MIKLITTLLASACSIPMAALSSTDGTVDFIKDVLPILEENCIDCHNADKQKSGLRLDLRPHMLKGGDNGLPSVVPGDPEASYIMEVVKGIDPDMQMPPKGDPLTADQITLLETWIVEGAIWPGQMDATIDETVDHWSLLPVVRPTIPEGNPHPVDAFLDAKLSEAGIVANEAAEARALVRRTSVVITGLPPTPERIEKFVSAYEENPEASYNLLVDELLQSSHYGERWAQHWLDVIRWAETNGSEANLYRKNAWLYRDYVINAFNNDLPYDQFITEQLAGDQIGAGVATGFLVAGPHVPAATVGREPTAIRQARADRMDEIMQTVGASMLGMTISCARCHNHKFDPISIKDYYALTAVFQGVEFGGRVPEYAPDTPLAKTAAKLKSEIAAERKKLKNGAGQWIENLGGYQDHYFPPTKTSALRIEFARPNMGIDELDIYGPANREKNFALASSGTTLVADETQTIEGNEPWKANDGEYGTMQWRAKREKKSSEQIWLEIRFPEIVEVDQFRHSGNREYYFETDYLDINTPTFSGYKISALQPDGSWKEIAKTGWATALLKKNPDLQKASEKLTSLVAKLREEGPRHSFVGQFSQPGVTKVLHRGSPENPRDEVAPAGFDILNGDLGLSSDTPDGERRLAFSKWVSDPKNPLPSRVMVNRLWHHIFGSGIVPTGGDFGLAGAPPSHPELLDWLAAEFIDKGWSTKSMIRLLVTSDAFKRSSIPSEAALAKDASSYYLWRYPPQRVEAEVIRDGILQASGKLTPSIGGRSFRIHNVKKTYAQWEVTDNAGPDTWRRMLYQERMRRVDDKIFTAFDFPDCGQVRAKRPVSTTPLQALNLMNSEFVVGQSEFIAERALRETGGDPVAAVDRAFELLLGRVPTSDESAAGKEVPLHLLCRTLINSNEFAFLP